AVPAGAQIGRHGRAPPFRGRGKWRWIRRRRRRGGGGTAPPPWSEGSPGLPGGLLSLLDGLGPRLTGVLLALSHRDQDVLDRGPHVLVLRPEVDRLHRSDQLAEDLADRGVVEVLARRLRDRRILRGLRRGREDLGGLVRADLALGRGQELGELDGLLLVLGLLGPGQHRAAHVAGSARVGRDVPLALAGLTGEFLDAPEHPGRAREGGEGVALQRRLPRRREDRHVGGELVLLELQRRVERLLDDGVAVEDEVVLLVEEAVPRAVARVLQDGGAEDGGRAVQPLGVGHLLLELLPLGEEVVPRRPELADLFAVGREAGLLEQVLAVAHGERADVGAEADELLAVLGDAHLPLPRQEVLLQLLAAVVKEVDELVRLLHVQRQDALLEHDDVAGAAAGGHPLLDARLVLVEAGDLAQLHRDVGVRLLVLLDDLLVPGLAEDVDGELDRTAVRAAALVVVPAAGYDQAADQHRSHRRAQSAPQDGPHGGPLSGW